MNPIEPTSLFAAPIIVVDSREKQPLSFRRFATVRRALPAGDYSLLSAEREFAIERKTVSDAATCASGRGRERFEAVLSKLRGCSFARLAMIGNKSEVLTGRYHAGIAPKTLMHRIAQWDVTFIPVVWIATPEEAARTIEAWAFWWSRARIECATRLQDPFRA